MTHNSLRLALSVTALAIGAAACSGDEPGEPVTYYQDVKPIVEKHCIGCHKPGGVGPFKLDSFDSVSTYAVPAATAMQSRAMPPWMPDPSCRKFMHERLMDDAEIDTFKRWVDGGRLEGDATQANTHQAATVAFEPTDVSKTPAYTPPVKTGDDYRCFILDLEFAKTMYMKASQVMPGTGLVHHVLVYAIEKSQVAAIEKADADEPGPGYTCFGGPLPKASKGGSQTGNFTQSSATTLLPNQLGGWVPGMAPQVLDENVGVRILEGSKIVMQIHYSALGGDPVPDATEFQMVLTDVPPEKLRVTRPVAILDIPIPAGEQITHTQEFKSYRSSDLVIRSVMGHMHLLGSKFSVQKVAADDQPNAADVCMLEIPKWDFNWQQTYVTPKDDAIVLKPGEKIRLSCSYDNTAPNQPIVDGARVEPKSVKWGEGTLDEMCLLYIDTVEPYRDPPDPSAPPCAPAQSCVDSCADKGIDCLLSCEKASDSCQLCTLTSLTKCAPLASCAAKLLAARSCLTSCGTQAIMLSGSLGMCLKAECKDQYDALRACTDPLLSSGQCNTQLSSCGVTF
ncbi:MAG: hypothetical protein KC503_05685 [Myxococcales bacterium]|nr:hypothetical protein [Myxococcales bacterium]